MKAFWFGFSLFYVAVLVAGCGEPASTYDEKRGRFVDTKQYREDQIERAIDKRERQIERNDPYDCFGAARYDAMRDGKTCEEGGR